jgi:hypothetical protein
LGKISQLLVSDEDQTNAFTYLVKVSKAIEISAIEPGQQERLGGGLDRVMRVKDRRYFASLSMLDRIIRRSHVSNPMWQWFFRWTSEAASAAVSEFG